MAAQTTRARKASCSVAGYRSKIIRGTGRLKFERLPQIAVRKLPKVSSVLHVQRQIETQRVTKLHQFSRRCSLAEHLFDGVAWHDVDHQKDQRQHQPQRGQREQENVGGGVAPFAASV